MGKMVFNRFKNMDAAEYRGLRRKNRKLSKYVGNLSASLNEEAYKKNPALSANDFSLLKGSLQPNR